MDLPHRQWKEHRPCCHDFGERNQEQPMKMESNKAFHPYGAQGAPRVNADVQRPDNIENYGEISTATATARKLEKISALLRPK